MALPRRSIRDCVRYPRGYGRLSKGNVRGARRSAKRARSDGGAAALNAMLGALCLQSGELDDALGYLRKAQAARPDDIIVALNLATALVQLGHYREALDAAAEKLAAEDQSLRLQRLRAFCAQFLDDFPAAIKAYERIVAVMPQDWESWNNLGNSRRGAGDLDGAVEALKRAAELAPDSPRYY